VQEADVAVLVVYFATMILVGIGYAQRAKSLDMYFAGGKQLSWWLGGVSIVMASVSTFSIVVYAALGYQYGLVALTIYWTTVPAVLLITWFFAIRWRRAGVLTPTEFLETRFSPAVRQLVVWSTLPLKVFDDALKIVAIGVFVAAGLKVSPIGAAVAVGLVTVLYTMMGGLWAVVITDFVQFVLVATGVVLLVPLTLRAAGGWHHVVAVLPPRFFYPVSAPYTWGYVGSFLLLNILSVSGNWSMVQRFYSARNDREARRIGWTAALLFFLLPPVWTLTGMFARAYIAPSGFDPQTVYARVSADLLPPGMFGLVIAALFAAAMSVISSSLNVTAAVLTIDVHQRLIHPDATQRELVFVGRVFTMIIGVLALIIALVVIHFHWSIFDAMVLIFGFFVPPTVLPLIAGLLTRRLSARGAIAGFVAGISVGVLFLFFRSMSASSNASNIESLTVPSETVVTGLVLFLAAILFPVKGEAADRSARFSEKLGKLALPTGVVEDPAPIAGLVIGVMGVVLAVLGMGVLAKPNLLTIGTGLGLLAIGLGMRWKSFSPEKLQLLGRRFWLIAKGLETERSEKR
jgi:SSS family solute:Na+ symporter